MSILLKFRSGSGVINAGAWGADGEGDSTLLGAALAASAWASAGASDADLSGSAVSAGAWGSTGSAQADFAGAGSGAPGNAYLTWGKRAHADPFIRQKQLHEQALREDEQIVAMLAELVPTIERNIHARHANFKN